MTIIASKRMDAARSNLMQSAAVFSKESAQTEPGIINIINMYVGPDKEQEEACDLAIQKHMTPKRLTFTSISIVEARDSGLPISHVHDAVTLLGQKELSPHFDSSIHITKSYYEKTSADIENALLVTATDRIIGFLIARIGTQSIKKIPQYCVMHLVIDSSYKREGLGTQLLLNGMSKAHALKMPLGLNYTTDSENGGTKGSARKAFYESFTSKFGIPTYNDGEPFSSWYFPVWDLEGIEALSIPKCTY